MGSPLLHLHGAPFFAWVLFLLSQTALAANGQLDHHRAWGLVGISLATSMVFIGLAAALNTLSTALAAGYGDSALDFFVVPVSAIGLFAGFIVAAIANIRRPQAHKRFMMLATISLLQAAMARVFFVLATGGGPGLRPGLGHPPLVFNTIVPLLPDIPTVGEFVPGYEASGWIGVGAPKRTSSDIIEKLSKEINAALADPNVKAPCRPGLHGVSKFTP